MYWSIMLALHYQSFQSISQTEIMEGDWDLSRTPQEFKCWHSIKRNLLGAEHLSQLFVKGSYSQKMVQHIRRAHYEATVW